MVGIFYGHYPAIAALVLKAASVQAGQGQNDQRRNFADP